ncbi:hypothetical protein [Paractinoplanes globisporus]|uniref:M23 family metallopeptidase n=2 Tax=Paractinoplanes globisporus TaxID=113565 RepID=A0ABW6WBB4_9ACTN
MPSIFVVLVMLAGPLVGCGHAAPEGPVPPAPAPPATSVSPARPSSPAPAWGSGPFTVVHHPAVPPVPVVTEIRAGAHPGFAGHTSIAVGTAGHSGFRVGELPGRIYVDVAH